MLAFRKTFVAAAALATGLVLAGPQAKAQDFVNILTGGTSGAYYPIGVALSNAIGKGMPGAKLQVQPTKASVENLNLLNGGKGEIAFTLGDSLSDAWNGKADAGFSTKLTDLRAVAAIYSNYIQIVASAGSGIKTLADLKGKRISVGAPKSGTELNARAVLGAAGLKYSDFSKVEYLGFGESVDLMKNRQLDVTLQSAALGVASIRDLANSIDIVIVSVPADTVAKIGDAAYVATSIPAGTYKGQDAATPAVAVGNFLVTNAKLSEDLVYKMTKATFDNLDVLHASHAAAKAITLQAASKNSPVPFHPGAVKFYKEKGLMN
ncbi:TAXI family TRAP transporter solute-binding subunit [Ferrovibrio sp.]|uniref:TAXI family TRAP transporter solute-binding subunit n=1 Tax=Ferrovibrio sp. TaxID=1917215 RepID=UPI0025BC9C39|nr:TAXI family TRAP transporter solute-binding subunit [Ferrovibrio sp.]MBX3455365.1 TAXI family TRAP transporter solute-binding subunit [Ferrovibrio sp.]